MKSNHPSSAIACVESITTISSLYDITNSLEAADKQKLTHSFKVAEATLNET
ncbi:MAG: hypothetical protein ACJARQ_000758 [Oleispira sp.]|jgi:hypothetical protein